MNQPVPQGAGRQVKGGEASLIRGLLSAQINGHWNKRAYMRRTEVNTGFPYSYDLKGHWGCVNTVEMSNGEGLLLCSGSDDLRVLIWDVFAAPEKQKPKRVLVGHDSNIFHAIFDADNRHILSCGNDERIQYYDLEHSPAEGRGHGPCKVYDDHSAAVTKLSYAHDSTNVFLSASNDCSVRLFDLRASKSQGVLVGGVFHGVACNPTGPLFATAAFKKGTQLWDLRSFSRSSVPIVTYQSKTIDSSSVKWNSTGNLLVAAYKSWFPTLYAANDASPLCTFLSETYCNKCTMKSCTFGGVDEELIVGGSDDFGVYCWEIPSQFYGYAVPDIDRKELSLTIPTETHVLRGHRSIVNNVCYNPHVPVMFSAGVEKIVKRWSPYPLCDNDKQVSDWKAREMLSLEDFIHDFVLTPEQPISEQSVDEDVRTLALFDYLNSRGSDEDDDEDDSSYSASDSDDATTLMDVSGLDLGDQQLLSLIRQRMADLAALEDEENEEDEKEEEEEEELEENEEEEKEKEEDEDKESEEEDDKKKKKEEEGEEEEKV